MSPRNENYSSSLLHSLCPVLCPCQKEAFLPCALVLCELSEFGSCVFCAPIDRYIGRHIDRHIGRVSVDISTDARPICRPTLGRYISRDVSVDILTDISTEISADISADTRPICWLICRPRVVVRQSTDMLIDRLPTFRRYLTATCACVHSTGDCSLSRRHNLTLVSDFS